MKALADPFAKGLGGAARRFTIGMGVFIGSFTFLLFLLRDVMKEVLAVLDAAK